jgi:nicotinamide riboside transporter PnuC
MKPSSAVLKMKYVIALLAFTFIKTLLWAQTETTESSSSSTKVTISEETTSDWYTNPIVWVVGAAIFILLLVALLRGGGRDRTVTHTDRKTTVVRDRDTDTGRV